MEESKSSLISKHNSLFEILESFLTTKSLKGLRASQLACTGEVKDYQTSKKDFKNFKDNFWDTVVGECVNRPLFLPGSVGIFPYLVLSLFDRDSLTL